MAEFSNHNWWVEGTAETVAQAIFPNSDFASKEEFRFSDRFRDTPLTKLTYENPVFFSGVWAQDPKLMFKIIDAMPVAGNEAAQQKALLGVIPADELSRFVRDYLDTKVYTPGSPYQAWAFPLFMITNIRAEPFDGDDTRDYKALPFALFALDATFSGGACQIDVQNVGAVQAQHRETEGEATWAEGSITAEGDCFSTRTYRLAGMATGSAKVQVVAKKDTEAEDCKACGAKSVRDQCLIGTWVIDNVTQGMSIAQYLSDGRPVGTMVQGMNVLSFDAHGDSVWGYQNFVIVVQDSSDGWSPAAGALLNGTIVQGWAAGNGRLNTCFRSADAEIRLGAINGNVGPPIDFNAVPDKKHFGHYSYDCDDSGTLILEKELGNEPFPMKLRKIQ